jgi:hypothetical protein
MLKIIIPITIIKNDHRYPKFLHSALMWSHILLIVY